MKDNQQEDLDALYVLRSIKKGIANLFKAVFWLLRFSYRKALTLLIFIIICVSLFSGIHSLQKPYYSSELIISHTRFENDYCAVMINNLNTYVISSDNRSEIANELSLPLSEAQEIISIKYAPLNANLATKYMDSVFVFLPFKVEVEVYNNEVLDKLQKGIMDYLENNEYATKRKEIEKESLDKTETRIKSEILETDSLKRLVNQSIVPRGGSATGIILGEPIDPVNVYKRSLDLYERQLLLNKKQTLNNSFEVIVGFIKKPKPANAGLLFYISLGILVGYILGIIWALKQEFKSPSA